jgi:membrane protein required for beta-lactamase induction
MEPRPLTRKSILLYVALQSITVLACWIWFAGLWSLASFNFGFGDIEWYLLVAAACAGLYGLRPNLEKAIDAAWLRGLNNANAVAERVARLRPIKRRIDLIFSIVLIGILLIVVAIWGISLVTGQTPGARQ